MPLLYMPVGSTMSTEEGEKLWYPHPVKTGIVHTQELAVK